MKVEATIKGFPKKGSIAAVADALIDGWLVIHGIKVFDGENGMGMRMPSEKWTNSRGEVQYTDIVHPITSEGRMEIFCAVRDAYEEKLLQREEMPPEEKEAAANAAETEKNIYEEDF